MREPGHWYRPNSILSRLLTPFGAIYGAIAARRMTRPGARAGIPVFCVGNYHVGGAGKTPTVLALAALLRELDEQPFVLSRGYGGRLDGPISVDCVRHSAADVGDEPLMMARTLQVVVARDRVSGAALARSLGASLILMDDGFQNSTLVKNASLVVIDGHRGIGNSRILPAGPLRAPMPPQLARTDALVIIGDGAAADTVAETVAAQGVPVLRAHLMPDAASVAALRGKRALAFAGIGDPQRFFATLRASGVDVAAARAFPDHHPYAQTDIEGLAASALRDGLALVTTEKDMARLRSSRDAAAFATHVVPFAVTLAFDDVEGLRQFLIERLNTARAQKF